MKANKNAAFHKHCFSTNQKPESVFLTYDPTSKCIMPSFTESEYKGGSNIHTCTLFYFPMDFRVAYAANISKHLTIR